MVNVDTTCSQFMDDTWLMVTQLVVNLQIKLDQYKRHIWSWHPKQ